MERVALPPFPRPRPLPPLDLPGIALPQADASHLPLFAGLHAASRAADLLLAPWSQVEKRAFLDQQFVLQHRHYVVAHSKGDFRAVTQAGTPIGRFYFNRHEPLWVLIDILLAVPAQGSGIGSALVGWLQRAAADAGAEGVRLSVMHNNPRARALYLRLGFADHGEPTAINQGMIWRP
ncbi:GNAT family N-acetyltransferase [Sphingomonas sp. R-74633]|uniref:GNAT family N-acetyltransferase n=1 Tax=Sphingomonas sp. R-74633 TaxID=2751188 RepID=UPI0015D23F2C|nr:GNAT family N-acetyltransferase [Sphingomonas sp. R-74633]NYT39175.1 GNAT family N-acetyltransferase [Sphingomonas sp. R-74633]